MFSVKSKKGWKNWSGSVVIEPKHYFEPRDLEELAKLVKHCAANNLAIRIVGAGHSFTPLVATSEVLISLDHISGIHSIDEEKKLARIWAGTRLKDLGPELFEQGYAMENLGDINEQSLAGAISTGTHGTGINFGSISTQVRGVTLLTATGELLEISARENEQYFDAVRLSLGLLGIIVRVTLKVKEAYQLIGESYRLSLEECLRNLESLQQSNRNFEFFWFPYTKTVQVKTLNKVSSIERKKTGKQTFKNLVIENGLYWGLSEISRFIPKTARFVSSISALGVPVGRRMGDSHIIYATPRLVKFQEMEYCVPKEEMANVLQDLNLLLQKRQFNVHFPIECRYVKKDSIWLSPSYERDSAYIAVHMYKGMEFQEYFEAVEEIFLSYRGKPHWGKMHSLNYHQIKDLYQKLDDFLQVREELDKNGLFLNPYLKDLFNI